MADKINAAKECPLCKPEPPAGYAVVPVELQETHLAAGVVALIDAGLDGPDGVGHSEVQAVWNAVIKAEMKIDGTS